MKEQIIETSLSQFLKHGIRKMTVQKLIEPLGISTKTVYKYFRDKEDLLKHCLLKHYAGLAVEFARMETQRKNPVVALYEIWYQALALDFGVNHLFYHDLNYYYSELQDLVLHRVFRKNFKALTGLVEEGIHEGLIRKGMVPEVVLEVSSMLYSTVTRGNQLKKFRLTTASLMQNTIYAYLRGICTEKGLKELEKNIQTI